MLFRTGRRRSLFESPHDPAWCWQPIFQAGPYGALDVVVEIAGLALQRYRNLEACHDKIYYCTPMIRRGAAVLKDGSLEMTFTNTCTVDGGKDRPLMKYPMRP